MTAKELIWALLDCDLDKEVYVADKEYNTKKVDYAKEWVDCALIMTEADDGRE